LKEIGAFRPFWPVQGSKQPADPIAIRLFNFRYSWPLRIGTVAPRRRLAAWDLKVGFFWYSPEFFAISSAFIVKGNLTFLLISIRQ
jgi:hypothetical protein